jgi:hypothetical protein
MIEIKNPYSKKRLTYKEKIQRKLTDLTDPWIRKLPFNEDWDAKPKYIPQFLNRIRTSVEYWDRDTFRNDIPRDVSVDLLSLYIAEYIPIENIDELNKGLRKLFKDFAPTRMNTNDLSRIDEFCKQVKQSIHSSRWSNFGFLEVPKDNDLRSFVSQIRVQASQVTSTTIIIKFIVEPSKEFLWEYEEILESNVKDQTTFKPKLKKLFSYWGASVSNGNRVKERLVEDLMLEFKWRTLKEISKYFELYFSQNGIVPPSIEVSKVNQLYSKFKYIGNEQRNFFWESIGMKNFNNEISKDGYWELHTKEGDYLIDSSIKLTCNAEIPKEDMFYSIEVQIVYFVEELAKYVLPILVMRNYTIALSENIAKRQKKTYKSIKKEKPNYKKLINIRYELEQSLQILKRFKSEFGEDEFRRIKSRIARNLKNFEPTRKRTNFIPWGEAIVDNTSFLIERTNTHSNNFAKIIDDTVRLLEIKTNDSLRRRTFWLTIVTVIVSVLAAVIAATSLYLQLSDDNRTTLKESFSSIIHNQKEEP